MLYDKHGLIVIGYQGIGKTTTTINHNKKCIDLESSAFKIDGKRYPDWSTVYAKQAVKLACQGHIVFVSSHKCVREAIANLGYLDCGILYCYPICNMKKKWIKRLRKRYEKDKSEKNFIAWKDALENFDEEITSLENDIHCDGRFVIWDTDYDLWKTLKRLCSIYSIKLTPIDMRSK